jgi:predicted amidohydrolase YtcJ
MLKAASVALLAFSALVAEPASAKPGDILFFNGKVLTVDKAFSIKSAVLVRGARIEAVGGRELVEAHPDATLIDLRGRTLMPGFIDTHLHLSIRSMRAIEPAKARSIVDLKRMVAAKAAELGKGEWIEGLGWDEGLFAEKRNPTRADLDAAAPNNPVALRRAGGHSVVANSLALKLAGIDRSTPDPKGGIIERDADGEPNGIIRERVELVTRLVPSDSAAERGAAYAQALRKLLELGITTVMEALVTIDDEPAGRGGLRPGDPPSPFAEGRPTWSILRAVYGREGEALPRLIAYISYPGIDRLKAFRHHTGYGDDRLKLGPIGETPYDGGFSGPTALTKEPYKGLPDFHGTALMSPDEALRMVEASSSLGWQLGIHTIGDAAIEQMVAVYEEVLKRRPSGDHRWFLAHLTMIPSVATMRTMARDRIWASVQPNFLYSIAGRYDQTLDGYRLEHINPVATPLRYGVSLAMSSDNLPIGPMVGIYAATTRRSREGEMVGREEAISRAEAIRLYTEKAAYLGWDERKKGTLEMGKLADLIVLDKDLMAEGDDRILTTKVDITMVNGRIVYRRGDQSGINVGAR